MVISVFESYFLIGWNSPPGRGVTDDIRDGVGQTKPAFDKIDFLEGWLKCILQSSYSTSTFEKFRRFE